MAREIFEARALWADIEALDNKVDAALQIRATLAMWNLLRQATRWLLTQSRHIKDIKAQIKRLAPGIKVLSRAMEKSMAPDDRTQIEAAMRPGRADDVATRAPRLGDLAPCLDQLDSYLIPSAIGKPDEAASFSLLVDAGKALAAFQETHAPSTSRKGPHCVVPRQIGTFKPGGSCRLLTGRILRTRGSRQFAFRRRRGTRWSGPFDRCLRWWSTSPERRRRSS